jgi:hypothetical protein
MLMLCAKRRSKDSHSLRSFPLHIEHAMQLGILWYRSDAHVTVISEQRAVASFSVSEPCVDGSWLAGIESEQFRTLTGWEVWFCLSFNGARPVDGIP